MCELGIGRYTYFSYEDSGLMWICVSHHRGNTPVSFSLSFILSVSVLLVMFVVICGHRNKVIVDRNNSNSRASNERRSARLRRDRDTLPQRREPGCLRQWDHS